MKKFAIFLLLISCTFTLMAQSIQGEILRDTGNLRVIKVWGTHYERGFAYGYLCGDKILDMYTNYFLENFGSDMAIAHDVVESGLILKIDSVFFDEAKGILAGMDSAGYAVDSIDHFDIIASNCLLEFLNYMKGESGESGMGCSSLMSWGTATLWTDIDGHSAITRHLDWTNDTVLLKNQVLIAHIPSEANERPWACIGFAGMMSALSGFNQYIGTFQHMMSDFSGNPVPGTFYEPIWFSLRKALELDDPNNDGYHDTKDVHDILAANTGGYADGFIICTLGPSTGASPALIAEVAELAPVAPYLTFRASDFPDSLAGDNLYAANYEIKRNNHYHFCTRYNGAVVGVGDGETIGSAENWNIMRDHSVSLNPMGNIQMMQFIPEEDIFRLSVQKNGMAAYQIAPDTFYISQLFSNPSGLETENIQSGLQPWYDRQQNLVKFIYNSDQNGKISISLFDTSGRLCERQNEMINGTGDHLISLAVKNPKSGIYILSVRNRKGQLSGKILIP